MADTINELFASPGATLPQDVTNELLTTMRLHSLSAQELFYKWESYVIKMGVDNTNMDYKTVKDFRKDLQDALDRESRAKAHVMQSASKRTAHTPRAAAVAVNADDIYGMLDGMASGTPASRNSGVAKRKANNFSTPAAKSVKNGVHSSPSDFRTPALPKDGQALAFEDRQNPGQVVESLNEHLPAATTSSLETPTDPRVKLKANTELPKFAYRGMAMKLSEASEILDDRIDNFTDLIQAHHQLPDHAFGNPAAQSTAEVVAVGRIACDVPNGKLNPASLCLETSRRMGAGLRVPLKLEGLSFDFFPGKIVALRGTNVSGEYFSATEVLEMPSLPVAASTPDELDVHHARLSGDQPLRIHVASGPYTTDSDLSFAALHALLEQSEAQKSDVLILTGPFLDLEHPLVASGDFEDHLPSDAKIEPDRATINDVFRILIAQPLQRLALAVPAITIIMVPSMRDVISRHVSWPQDRFSKQNLGLPKQVQVVTNPITLSINEMIVGISSQDVLSELRRENVCQFAKGQSIGDDVLARLSGAVIDQRHYFPIFPAQARESLPNPTAIPGETPEVGGEERLAVGASLDIGYLKLGEWLNVRPDILILPSVLSPFAKVVNSVVCINPGTLSKKRGTGTFTSLSVQPRTVSAEEREAGEPLAHNLFQRARIDVVRI
ncbi:DNA polymerase alpha subunit B N-terminal-domain-containing protein [Neohortaea acidophila]|uniref:DNA polymerase alpha subunit B n=1 Tax=Neohortaea acidophila TaxID=245834 RepID=A0A6A6Q1S4_9PEZI|nr:DNA polymerase alpha subunit B N-terminal-domain-containing protein [Neohortaea acidophila]KAF2486215.1 DNA polymerase alpha subunit B N-terminal-domain-containing protein [Neohortaea acidophila]